MLYVHHSNMRGSDTQPFKNKELGGTTDEALPRIRHDTKDGHCNNSQQKYARLVKTQPKYKGRAYIGDIPMQLVYTCTKAYNI